MRDLEYLGRSSIGEQVDTTVQSAVHFATHVQDSLDGIRDNTKRLFWWTSTLVIICLGLFVLALLVRLRHELVRISRYLELYLRMWDEERRLEEERIKEERLERQIAEQNRRARAAARHGRGGMAAQYQGETGPGAPGAATGVNYGPDSAPPQAPDRNEWLRQVAATAQRLRRAQQERQEQGEEGIDDDEMEAGPAR